MTMAGGFDVDRRHHVHYVGNDGLRHGGQIRPDTRKTLRRWLAEYCPEEVTSSVEGCTS
jgi:transposase